MQQPQEIEVWYILPAVRRELAKVLIEEHNLPQKEAARILDVSAPAISQYMKSKRAKEVTFTENTSNAIRKAAENIIQDIGCLREEIQKICETIKEDMTLCQIHKLKDSNVSDGCRVCLRN